MFNGDTSNDTTKDTLEKLDRSHEGGRHGGDIQGVINSLDYLSEMGFTQIWLNPVLENNMKKYSYHGYSTTDFYRVDPRMGSNQLYKDLSKLAKAKGIGLIKDIILNHIGSNHWWMKDLPATDWINNTIKGKPSFKATSHKRESLHDPHSVEEDKVAFSEGWFVPTMPDLNQKNTLVANYLIQNSIWWTEYADLSGIRIDTYSYSDPAFLSEYTRRIMQEYPNFKLVGEEWSLNPAIIAHWQKGTLRNNDYQSDLKSLMDFPLQNALTQSLIETESWSDGLQKLYATLASDFIYASPEDLMIFTDNHDMSRIATQLNNDPALIKMALAILLTTRGVPQIFYGTEIGMHNNRTDSHGVIRTEFPGGWADHRQNAFDGSGLEKDALDIQAYLKALLNWRKQSVAVTQGELKHYAPKDGVYVYFRSIDADGAHENNQRAQRIMVIVNKNKKAASIRAKDYPSMLKGFTRAKDVLSSEQYDLNKAIEISPTSVMILEIQ